jgi:hypothetical protein
LKVKVTDETSDSILTRILKTSNDSKLVFVRFITGAIFVSEGIQKYLVVSLLGPSYFMDLGFGHPMFWSLLHRHF